MHDTTPTQAPDRERGPIRIGVSMCLLGEHVRYDGGHRHDRFLTDTLGRYFEWVPVCPEVELGMGTPREPIQLVESAGGLRLLGVESRRDHTRAMQRYARRRVAELADLGICGYIFKQGSPSCGPTRVRVHDATTGRVKRTGRGLFVEALLRRLPHLPVEDESRLADPTRRENWIERVVTYHRLSRVGPRWTDLVAFHCAHRLTLLAHAPRAYDELHRWLATARRSHGRALRREYQGRFMSALSHIATRPRHARVLRDVVACLTPHVEAATRTVLLARIVEYQGGRVSLTVPRTILMHYARQAGVAELRNQVYLEPHPIELVVRSQA